MLTGIVVPSDPNLPLRTAEFHELTDYQAAVGGLIEIITIPMHPLVIVANEEGKVRRLGLNKRATCLWWLLNPEGTGGEELVGEVVILGPVEDCEMTNAPKRFVDLLFHSTSYQVQVRLSEEFDTWVPIGPPVEDFFEATARALRMIEVWRPPGDVEVVAVS